ncbi:MAG: YkgJ family cysteine cluster protein [Phycisphaerae bacterium]|nr:YkgJ family cysteine cluster protein [Phycisphaerae bacterium]
MPSQPWYADGLRFQCTRCGNCCSGPPGYVWVSKEEVAAIARQVGLTPDEFTDRHTRTIGSRRSLLELDGGDCEFLDRRPDGTTGCRIHRARPVQCRTWPFWASNLKSNRSWEATGRVCPGLNRGELHPLPVIQQQRHAGASRPI